AGVPVLRARVLAEEAPAPDTRRAAQCIDLEPRVIGDRLQPARKGISPGLVAGVLLERRRVLRRLGRNAVEIVGRHELEVEPVEDLAIFLELPRVRRPEQDPVVVDAPPSAARCAVTRRALPPTASGGPGA